MLAYWHEPRWSSGNVHGNDSSSPALWNDLLNPSGASDANGIREFVVGTGGWGSLQLHLFVAGTGDS